MDPRLRSPLAVCVVIAAALLAGCGDDEETTVTETFVCAGDSTLGGPDTLGYGQTAQRGPFLCESGEQELVCSHTGNGHGFSLSRQGYRIF